MNVEKLIENKNYFLIFIILTILCTVILFGLMCVFLSPIGSVSDEVEHFTRAEITSQGVLFPEYISENNTQGI